MMSKQDLANGGLWAQTSLLLFFVPRHIHLFVYNLWKLSCYDRIEKLQQRSYNP